MHGAHIVAPIVCGFACIALGVGPGLLSGLTQAFHDSLPRISPWTPRRWRISEKSVQPDERIWFVVGGVAFLLLAILAYFSG